MWESPPGWDVVEVVAASGTTTPSTARGASSSSPSPSSATQSAEPAMDAGGPSGSSTQAEGEGSTVHHDDDEVDSGAALANDNPDTGTNVANINATSINDNTNVNTNPASNDDVTNVNTTANVNVTTDGITHTSTGDNEGIAAMTSENDISCAKTKTAGSEAKAAAKSSTNDNVKGHDPVDAEDECNYADDGTWTKGDITVISSDGVRFRIPSYKLIGFWPLVRARVESPIQVPRVVTLAEDEHNEADTVRHFLHLATEFELVFAAPQELYLLVHFLKAHKCRLLLRQALCLVREALRVRETESITVFVVGAIALDRVTLRYALEHYQSVQLTWPTPKCTSTNTTTTHTSNCTHGEYNLRATPGAPVFDPFHWPLDLWYTVPTEVIYVLAIVWRKTKGTLGLAELFMTKLEEQGLEGSEADTDDEEGDTSNDTSGRDDEPALIVDDAIWKDGDFELITVDNVRFRVNSFDLFSRSGFFRDSRGLNAKQSLTFTDPDIETSVTLRRYLELVRTGGVSSLRYGHWGYDLVSLANFLQKFDCTADLSVFLLHLRELVREGDVSSLAVFSVGAIVQDRKTIQESLKVRHSKFSPYRYTIRYWKSIPTNYLWAHGRAWNKTGASEDLPSEFNKWIKVANSGRP